MDKKQEKKKKRKKEKEKEKEKENGPNYFSDTVTFCGTVVRDSMMIAAETIQNNYYPIKESILNIYDSYFCDNSQHNSSRVNGGVPFFTVNQHNSKKK
ncbi:conserved Plasmodium protein, unknown function [Plasmodium knowlesi strain H]|uniref:Uncharacterized protein n=3 Tax=Plasmodium knowlesi TaxID=5850 RepID=A0A5K1UQI8_PLAKH|nr:conserved Plasmodium protein, unknown function [Plasmodium knowlesi strain H]OTN68523.1 Uncharacterized protein PKNOH_S02294300 [Plasmodium knowlesi]CAA9986448.1 conserved Plasmodium protein, unknown function [Plasmodium knowlesi strain H]SBO24304.1 conserved Plasmodium protein, unknown function [Plasmodium knowlesi strain H]SBO29696.1 conserved Plasmodium protein, unknown function [Plasmodium knowlesi strain H]VVS75922.1 conserved Plasmodium protein, unknown function [Plasmodium knowlesi s|eukprot:XP_002260999.1 hypothetical protein, conserved in Plasmodium species [Plasmodium knowlesi strain H]